MDLHRRPGGLLIGHGLAKKSQTRQSATPCGFKGNSQFERVCAEYGLPFNCASTRESGPRSDVRKASVRGPLLALLSLRITRRQAGSVGAYESVPTSPDSAAASRFPPCMCRAGLPPRRCCPFGFGVKSEGEYCLYPGESFPRGSSRTPLTSKVRLALRQHPIRRAKSPEHRLPTTRRATRLIRIQQLSRFS